jgi:hypothetical protein
MRDAPAPKWTRRRIDDGQRRIELDAGGREHRRDVSRGHGFAVPTTRFVQDVLDHFTGQRRLRQHDPHRAGDREPEHHGRGERVAPHRTDSRPAELRQGQLERGTQVPVEHQRLIAEAAARRAGRKMRGDVAGQGLRLGADGETHLVAGQVGGAHSPSSTGASP